MTDSRFKFLVTAVSVVVIAIAAMYFFSPKQQGTYTADTSSKDKEYVYIDNMHILHTNRKCSRLNYKGLRSERYKISDGGFSFQSFCPKCVTDKEYEEIQDLAAAGSYK